MKKKPVPVKRLSNFRWIVKGELAASAVPLSLESIKHSGINTVVSLIPLDEQFFKKAGRWGGQSAKAWYSMPYY